MADSKSGDSQFWRDHLRVALKDLAIKVSIIDMNWRYYDGEHPRVWLTESLPQQLNDELVAAMADNWCDQAVDKPLKRLSVTGWVSPDDDSIEVEAVKNVFDDNDLDLDQTELYRDVRVAGEGFLFMWRDEDKEHGLDLSVNDPRLVWWPKDAHRSDPERVVKVWPDEDEGVWRATCYYRDVVVRLVGPGLNGSSVMPSSDNGFIEDPEDKGGAHGFDRVPVVRFAMQRKPKSVVALLRSTQDKINKLSCLKMVTGEFNTWNKMAIMTEQEVPESELSFKPNRALLLHPGGGVDSPATSIWEGSATDITLLDRAIDREIEKLFSKADMPGHMQVKSDREVPSGAAYEADEGPFVEMIGDLQRMFAASWQDAWDISLGVDVKPQWRNAAIKSDMDEMSTVKTATEAGMPLNLALKHYAGWDAPMLKELEEQPMSPTDMQALATTKALGGLSLNPSTQPAGDNLQGGGDADTPQGKQAQNGTATGSGNPGFGKRGGR